MFDRHQAEEAQTMAEYAIVLSVISAVVILTIGGLSSAVLGMLQRAIGIL